MVSEILWDFEWSDGTTRVGFQVLIYVIAFACVCGSADTLSFNEHIQATSASPLLSWPLPHISKTMAHS